MSEEPQNQDQEKPGDDAWMDAVISEHARLGKQDDEFFLQRLDDALKASSAPATQSQTQSSKPGRRRPQRSMRAWWIGTAACVLLGLTLLWVSQPPQKRFDAVAYQAELEAPPTVGTPAEGWRPLETTLPDELIEGTPKPVRLPQLVAVPKGPPTLMVPKETVLLSRGKPVSSSDDAPIIGNLALITDGQKEAGEGYYVELLDGLQWVQIDLGQEAAIHAVWLWHFHSQHRAYHDVIIQVSNDPEFRKGVSTVYNNDYANTAKMGRGGDNPYVESRFGLLANAGGKAGRYVRLYSRGNSSNEMNHYIEVEVFGVPREKAN